MNMHILVVVNGLSRKEESSILSLKKFCKKQRGTLRVDLLYVIPTKPLGSSDNLLCCGKTGVRKEPTRVAKLELSRCANLFGCADSQQWIAMGAVSQEAMTLAKKLHAQTILLSGREDLVSVSFAQCPRLPRVHPVSQYVDMHCVRTGVLDFIFEKEVAVA